MLHLTQAYVLRKVDFPNEATRNLNAYMVFEALLPAKQRQTSSVQLAAINYTLLQNNINSGPLIKLG